jgi:hypothetical protein
MNFSLYEVTVTYQSHLGLVIHHKINTDLDKCSEAMMLII